jgi:hypothetical protein
MKYFEWAVIAMAVIVFTVVIWVTLTGWIDCNGVYVKTLTGYACIGR